ncbi:hypothetical protein [Herbiconiux ginsengi]|uniref:Uncharacterized protein n=1 Tax=Herbiconiux ginsengi TaxID=381665 RepID=A0A1H3KNN4_9MICO|nr:hypothetical protein [Herbiconiux ginsengi]SDY53669.1 hypothetical protein SAMN05216554_0632 [Herbiconiux ginsengi]
MLLGVAALGGATTVDGEHRIRDEGRRGRQQERDRPRHRLRHGDGFGGDRGIAGVADHELDRAG